MTPRGSVVEVLKGGHYCDEFGAVVGQARCKHVRLAEAMERVVGAAKAADWELGEHPLASAQGRGWFAQLLRTLRFALQALDFLEQEAECEGHDAGPERNAAPISDQT